MSITQLTLTRLGFDWEEYYWVDVLVDMTLLSIGVAIFIKLIDLYNYHLN